jgi:hypothetical protein
MLASRIPCASAPPRGTSPNAPLAAWKSTRPRPRCVPAAFKDEKDASSDDAKFAKVGTHGSTSRQVPAIAASTAALRLARR